MKILKQEKISGIVGAWMTDRPPVRQNKLCLVICTFRREDYIYRNTKKIKRFLQENPSIKKRFQLYISDNGRTLDSSIQDDNVHVFTNINAGGAGGFTRGLIEAMKDGTFTRVLFMDDDVNVFPESFLKTLYLADYLKKKWNDAFINGAMLVANDRTLFYENLGMRDGLFIKKVIDSRRIISCKSILETNAIPVEVFSNPQRKVHSAWWYHCFNIEVAEKKGLPMPFFFRSDDIEWSWRSSGNHHISMNGISVWHEGFDWRVSPVADYYYWPRNLIITNMIHTDGFEKLHRKYLNEYMNRILGMNDYISAKLLIEACRDVIQYKKTFTENPEVQFKRINDINRQREIIDVSEEEIEKVKPYLDKRSFWERFVWRVSLNGRLIGEGLKSGESKLSSLKCGIKYFRTYKRQSIYNLLTRKKEIREYSKKNEMEIREEFARVLDQLSKSFIEISEALDLSENPFITREFWWCYLRLDN